MMAQHKWHKEIKAWADGAEIEMKFPDTDWMQNMNLMWDLDNAEFRIKPQPKEPQYLYAHRTNEGDITFEFGEGVVVVGYEYIGKIKLEVDDVGST
jgi:hypothetical protein